MTKYNIGDKVKIRNDEKDEANQSRLFDLESDMRMDLADRNISGTAYDKLWKAIEQGKAFIVTEVEDDDHPIYGVKLEGTNVTIGYMIHEEDLEGVK